MINSHGWFELELRDSARCFYSRGREASSLNTLAPGQILLTLWSNPEESVRKRNVFGARVPVFPRDFGEYNPIGYTIYWKLSKYSLFDLLGPPLAVS